MRHACNLPQPLDTAVNPRCEPSYLQIHDSKQYLLEEMSHSLIAEVVETSSHVGLCDHAHRCPGHWARGTVIWGRGSCFCRAAPSSDYDHCRTRSVNLDRLWKFCLTGNLESFDHVRPFLCISSFRVAFLLCSLYPAMSQSSQ